MAKKTRTQAEQFVPRYLGVARTGPTRKLDLIPWRGEPITVTLECEEFSSLCPVTGQPDYGALSISYRPKAHVVETKSLRLYLLQFRNEGVFNEVLVDRVANELWRQLKPAWVIVEGRFRSRGGIRIQARAVRPVGAWPDGLPK